MSICSNGKKMARKLRGVAITSLMFALVAGISSTAKAQDERSGLPAPIEGSWIFTVSATNGAFSFTALASFTAGGVFLATGSNDHLNPVSPLYGSWKRKGPNRFNATADFFGFDPSGNPISMLHDVMEYELSNRDELVGRGELLTCQVSGENCQRTLNFTVTAKRIIPEDLTGEN
jgi:hypothetical protein